jgi:hypothetical protein
MIGGATLARFAYGRGQFRDFIERFISQGYLGGMAPSLGQPRLTMDQFMPNFLRSFSTKGLASNTAKQP